LLLGTFISSVKSHIFPQKVAPNFVQPAENKSAIKLLKLKILLFRANANETITPSEHWVKLLALPGENLAPLTI